MDKTQKKINFSGIVRSVQPRSNVWRYKVDNRTHSMTGYNIFLKGIAEDEEKPVLFHTKIWDRYMMRAGSMISARSAVGMMSSVVERYAIDEYKAFEIGYNRKRGNKG